MATNYYMRLRSSVPASPRWRPNFELILLKFVYDSSTAPPHPPLLRAYTVLSYVTFRQIRSFHWYYKDAFLYKRESKLRYEWFSLTREKDLLEYRKTETQNNYSDQSQQTERAQLTNQNSKETRDRCQAQENAWEKVTISFDFVFYC